MDLSLSTSEFEQLKQTMNTILENQKQVTSSLPKKGGMELWEEITGLKPNTFYSYKSVGRVPIRVYHKHEGGKKIIFNREELISWYTSGMPTPEQERVKEQRAGWSDR